MIEERRFVRHELVVALVKTVDFRERKIPAEQVRDRRVIEPMPVQAPLAARIDEPVKHESLQHLLPSRPLAAGRKFFPPKIPEPELLPQLAAQPARAPLARPAQRHLPEPQAHRKRPLRRH